MRALDLRRVYACAKGSGLFHPSCRLRIKASTAGTAPIRLSRAKMLVPKHNLHEMAHHFCSPSSPLSSGTTMLTVCRDALVKVIAIDHAKADLINLFDLLLCLGVDIRLTKLMASHIEACSLS
ncbi:unnamed protein product [Mesocestoides corti]|uniref:Uncharacterized protein n=1 Tax=Mesocestoides corti TaxID=53468 RepID=A0A0R3U9J3_MESCO|nr:unnamed protein product [Mesocestoides corti]